MSPTLDDTFRVTRDEKYLRDLKAEAEFFDKPQLYNLDVEKPVVDAYLNKRFTGDEGIGCFDTIPRYGTFHRGCSFGTGSIKQEARILEQNPTLHLTFYDISAESLAERERTLGARFPKRVATERMDLNFVELPEGAFDLVVSAGCIHHLENLEHVAYQLNKTLTPTGYVFLYDYVGKSRFQFRPSDKRVFEAAIDQARSLHPVLRNWRVAWSDLNAWEHSPFCSVRSEETLDVFRSYLSEVSLRPGGSLVWMFLWLRPAPDRPAANRWRRMLSPSGLFRKGTWLDNMPSLVDVFREVAPDLLWLDTALTDAGLFQPWNAFAIYRKRPATGD